VAKKKKKKQWNMFISTTNFRAIPSENEKAPYYMLGEEYVKYAADQQIAYLISEWSKVSSDEDNDLSGIIADMMEERPPPMQTERQQTRWTFLLKWMRARHEDRTKIVPFTCPV
jgi:hypothetical protein